MQDLFQPTRVLDASTNGRAWVKDYMNVCNYYTHTLDQEFDIIRHLANKVWDTMLKAYGVLSYEEYKHVRIKVTYTTPDGWTCKNGPLDERIIQELPDLIKAAIIGMYDTTGVGITHKDVDVKVSVKYDQPRAQFLLPSIWITTELTVPTMPVSALASALQFSTIAGDGISVFSGSDKYLTSDTPLDLRHVFPKCTWDSEEEKEFITTKEEHI